MELSNVIKIGMADDHILLRKALANLIMGFENCRILHQFNNGREVMDTLHPSNVPDIMLLDLNMPMVDGYDTAVWLQKNFPSVHVLMLTMYDSELAMIRLLQAGVKGFLRKDVHPEELRSAIFSVVQAGYYYSNHTTGKLANLFKLTHGARTLEKSFLNEVELEFLKLACTDLTYKEVAQRMGLNPRSVDTLRDQLFMKLDVKSRVGMAMVSIRHGIVGL